MTYIFLDATQLRGIHITCLAEHLLNLVTTLEQEIIAIHATTTLIDWGWSCKQHRGYLVLEWVLEDEEILERALTRWQANPHIDDICLYSIPCDNNEAYEHELSVHPHEPL